MSKYCGECGEVLKNKSASICLKCGCAPSSSKNFCISCGIKTKNKKAVVCTSCGSSLSKISKFTADKDPTIAILIALIGWVVISPAIAYLYLGYNKKCLVYVSTHIVIYLFYVVGTVVFCLLPFIVLLHLILAALVTYDVYLIANGRETILPSIN